MKASGRKQKLLSTKAATLALERIHAWALAEPEVQILAGHEATLEQRYPLYPDALVPDGLR